MISTFSAVVPAEDANAVLNLSCLSWSKLACHRQHIAQSVAEQGSQHKQYGAWHATLHCLCFAPDLTFVYGKATTSWTKFSVFTTRSGCMQSAKANVTPESDLSMLSERSRCLRGSKTASMYSRQAARPQTGHAGMQTRGCRHSRERRRERDHTAAWD